MMAWIKGCESAHCLEVGMWVKGCEAGACVEVADIGTDVLIRDSKDPMGPVLRFTREEWENFVNGVKEGKFD